MIRPGTRACLPPIWEHPAFHGHSILLLERCATVESGICILRNPALGRVVCVSPVMLLKCQITLARQPFTFPEASLSSSQPGGSQRFMFTVFCLWNAVHGPTQTDHAVTAQSTGSQHSAMSALPFTVRTSLLCRSAKPFASVGHTQALLLVHGREVGQVVRLTFEYERFLIRTI